MANRREILRAGLAISVAPILKGAALLFSSAPPDEQVTHPHPDPLAQLPVIDGFVFDNRFVESVEGARTAARHGVTLHEINGDVTDLWYHHLDFRWRGNHGALAGITGDDALFVFENLAWDRRLRVIYRGRHAPRRAGVVEHTLTGPAGVTDSIAVPFHVERWPHLLGLSLASWAGRREPSKTTKLTAADEAPSDRRTILMSWIIAPSSWGLDQV